MKTFREIMVKISNGDLVESPTSLKFYPINHKTLNSFYMFKESDGTLKNHVYVYLNEVTEYFVTCYYNIPDFIDFLQKHGYTINTESIPLDSIDFI